MSGDFVSHILQLNLINVLTFYLILMFVFGTWRRMRQYGEFGRLLLAAPMRWPRLVRTAL
jgi:hypothetical protein